MGTKLYLNPQLFDVLLCLTMVLLARTLLGLPGLTSTPVYCLLLVPTTGVPSLNDVPCTMA